ncbi:hypothetical protein BC936DRAFT_148841 [Jimgerdemannia flammicorona]|uniref:Uncharacterized protein n=1 Tax=Jimgerdemannia flammicorona TaxID=994334 RepID=A0A433DNK8_9FUNG|nr:hypothetical protein BC936DRAFT_148841 [Jimgerdemannia flammicorona]
MLTKPKHRSNDQQTNQPYRPPPHNCPWRRRYQTRRPRVSERILIQLTATENANIETPTNALTTTPTPGQPPPYN